MPPKGPPAKKNFVQRFFSALGPGVITGAADDDPSGIATYSVAGAALGTSLLWTAFITWPLMAAVQMMCARIGMVTGRGLAGALRQKFPAPLIGIAALALLIANTINVGADLTGMADVAGMLTGFNTHFFVVVFAGVIGFATIRFRYYQIASILKWLALTLFAYVITAIVIRPNWTTIARDTFVPSWPKGHEAWATLVAILGTTISPYLFFWQASQEVEEEKAFGRRMRVRRQGATSKEIKDRKLDVGVGTFFSNVVMYFIILTTALTLHTHGLTNISKDPQHFADMVQYMDKLIGKLIAALDRVGLRENTLLLFLGDNGTGAGTRSMMGDKVVIGGKASTRNSCPHGHSTGSSYCPRLSVLGSTSRT